MIAFTELKSTNRRKLEDVLPLPKPFTLLIEPSSLCTFRCIQCFQSVKADNYFTRGRMNMPLARFQRVIEQLRGWDGPQLKVLKLSLYGEPLLNPHFCEMLRLAHEANVAERLETTTNASLLSPTVAAGLVEHQLDYLRVSIYATGQAQHETVTGTTLDFRTIHDNLARLQDLKRRTGSERPFVVCKMLDSYGEDNDRFRAMYGDVADEVFLDKPHGWIRVGGRDFIDEYYQGDTGEVRQDLKRHRTRRIACPMAFTTMAVRSNGDVSPCCVDYIGGTNLGNVEDTSLEALWNSDTWHAFMKMQLEGRKHEVSSCAHCDFYANDYYIKDTIDEFDPSRLGR
jgi:radical SAM protein with 4Fe4S-binding SPASM domain